MSLATSSKRINPRWFAPGSAILLLLTFAPFNWTPLLAIALVPLLVRLSQPDVRPFRCGYGFGVVYGLGQLFWLSQLTARWTGSAWLAAVPLLLATSLFAIYFGLTAWLIQRCWKWQLPWVIPFVWAGVEVFRSYIPVLAFPWGLIASPLWRYAVLTQSAHYGTIFSASACILLVNTTLAMLWRAESFMRVRWYLAACSVAIFVPALANINQGETTSVRVTAGQPGVDLAFGDPKQMDLGVRFNVARIQEEALNERSQLLVLPEGLIHSGPSLPPRVPFSVDSSLPILFGGLRGDAPAYQSAFAYDGKWSVIDKTRLVIFGEFVPGRGKIPFLDQFNLPTGDISAGDRVRALKIGKITVGPMICFEGLFPDVSYHQSLNGSQILAVMSMDDWFMNTTAPDQLKAAAVWRAVETGLPVVRSASTGYTMIVDAKGNILGEAPLGTAFGLTRDVAVPVPSRAWWLPIFPLLSLTATILMSVSSVVFAKQEKDRVEDPPRRVPHL